jgi:hypothetical protein
VILETVAEKGRMCHGLLVHAIVYIHSMRTQDKCDSEEGFMPRSCYVVHLKGMYDDSSTCRRGILSLKRPIFQVVPEEFTACPARLPKLGSRCDQLRQPPCPSWAVVVTNLGGPTLWHARGPS